MNDTFSATYNKRLINLIQKFLLSFQDKREKRKLTIWWRRSPYWGIKWTVADKYFHLKIKQFNTRGTLPSKHDFFTCEDNMLSAHGKISTRNTPLAVKDEDFGISLVFIWLMAYHTSTWRYKFCLPTCQFTQ